MTRHHKLYASDCCCRCMQGQKEGPAQGFAADFLGRIAGLVDDMAALLSASVLQLLGGCRGVATAWVALQARGVSLWHRHYAIYVNSGETAAAAHVSRQIRHSRHVLSSLHRA